MTIGEVTAALVAARLEGRRDMMLPYRAEDSLCELGFERWTYTMLFGQPYGRVKTNMYRRSDHGLIVWL